MLAGLPATFVTPGNYGSESGVAFLPSDLDGTYFPPSGTGNPFVSFPGSGSYRVRLFHADFVTPDNTTFNLIGSPAAAGFYRALSRNPSLCAPVGTGSRIWTALATV